MHALIDADRLAYSCGGAKDDDGYPLEWPLVASRVDNNLKSLIQAVAATNYSLFLTADDKSNFRIRVASIRPYKGHRSSEKPFWYEQVRRYLIEEWNADCVSGMEADDAIGIESIALQDSRSKNDCDCPIPVICSVDKDLDMIPGLHYNELRPERGIYEISEVDGLRDFYKQLLTGDPTDNIPGLFGVGRSSQLCRKLEQILVELDMYSHVRREYERRFGSYWKQFLWENAALLWIKRSPVGAMAEIYERLEELERAREKSLEVLGSEVDLKTE